MVHKVYVIGMGMGNPATLTLAAREALRKSELIIGSPRLLDSLGGAGARLVPLVASGDIARELRDANEHAASVVMSGDVGFYSGATALFELLGDMDGVKVTTIPGVSSLAYLCAALQTTWQDAFVVSAHGRACDVAGSVQCHAKTFVLLGGQDSAANVCAQLVERNLAGVRVSVGERLSYEDERIVRGTAAELVDQSFKKLSVMLVENDHPLQVACSAPHLADSDFVRGKVPMTKEEVRELAICKLRILPTDVVWDVGAGTGSVSVEAARAAYAGQVFSVEKSDEALALLRANKETFRLPNLRIVAGEAPVALAQLPMPNCVFVGGTSGKLAEILRSVLAANPYARLCIVAITLETLSQALACVAELGLDAVDIVQVSVAKAHEVGTYHLMRANNPVYLLTAEGVKRLTP